MATGVQAKDQGSNIVSNVFEWSGATQKLAMAGSSVQSTAFDQDRVVRIVATAACNYAIGTNPTATSSTVYLPADSGEQILIRNGNKIAALAASGSFYITNAG